MRVRAGGGANGQLEGERRRGSRSVDLFFASEVQEGEEVRW